MKLNFPQINVLAADSKNALEEAHEKEKRLYLNHILRMKI